MSLVGQATRTLDRSYLPMPESLRKRTTLDRLGLPPWVDMSAECLASNRILHNDAAARVDGSFTHSCTYCATDP